METLSLRSQERLKASRERLQRLRSPSPVMADTNATSTEVEDLSLSGSPRSFTTPESPSLDHVTSQANPLVSVRLSEPDSTPSMTPYDYTKPSSNRMDEPPTGHGLQEDVTPDVHRGRADSRSDEYNDITLANSPGPVEQDFPSTTNSMVTVRLSEPDSIPLTVPFDDIETASVESDRTIEPPQPPALQRADSFDIVHGRVHNPEISREGEEPPKTTSWSSIRDSTQSQKTDGFPTFQEEDVFENASTEEIRSRSNSNSSSSHDSAGVDWSELEETEKGETRDEASDQVRHVCPWVTNSS